MNNIIIKNEENLIQKTNLVTKEKGLILTHKEIEELIINKNEALNNLSRIEVTPIIDKIIYEFYDSPYIDNDNYFETINSLVEIFYIYEDKFGNKLSIEEIIKYLRDTFDSKVNGVVELLIDTSYLEREHDE